MSRTSPLRPLEHGVTRGKRLVVLVGQKKAVAIAMRNISGRKHIRLSQRVPPTYHGISRHSNRGGSCACLRPMLAADNRLAVDQKAGDPQPVWPYAAGGVNLWRLGLSTHDISSQRLISRFLRTA